MTIPNVFHRPFGNTGLVAPPITFRADVLDNPHYPLPEQTRRLIVGKWLTQFKRPIWIDVPATATRDDPLQTLGKLLSHYDVSPDEVIVNVEFGSHCGSRSRGQESLSMNFERACNLLGENRVTGMVTVARSVAASPDEYLRQVEGLRSQHERTAVGIAVQNLSDAMEWGDDAPFDFVKLARGPTILRHPPEMLDLLAPLAARNIPVLCGGIFQGGFLVGGSKFDKRVIDSNNPADQALMTWRKAFTALCHGHGVRPAHACIQFALSIPGVTTLSITTAHADRIAENCDAAMNPVPSALWDSMREEGLFVDGS